MKLSDLEKTLRRGYDSKIISPSLRGMVMEYLRGHPSVQDQDPEHIKLFTKVAKNAYFNNREGFDWSLVDRLLTYHDEGVEAGKRANKQSPELKWRNLYVHMAAHAVDLIHKATYVDRQIPHSTRQQWWHRGLDLANVVENDSKDKTEDLVLSAKQIGSVLAFNLYFDSDNLDYAERGYKSIDTVCSLRKNRPDTYPLTLTERQSQASRVLVRLILGQKTTQNDLLLWANRVYEATSVELPHPPERTAYRLYNRAVAAEEVYKITKDRLWKERSLDSYYRFFDYRKGHINEQFPASLERHAEWFVNHGFRK